MDEETLSAQEGFHYEYPIFDQTNQEITNPDLEKGYLKKEYFTIHHPMVPERWHYKVVSFDFSNGEIYAVESENDPHIKVIDAQKGIFEYVNLDGEEIRTVVGQTITAVIDQREIPAYDEETIFYRYVLYTEKELADKEFIKNGPQRLAEAQETIEELLIVLAELLGGNETEESEEEPVTPSDDESVIPSDSETEESTDEEPVTEQEVNNGN